MKNPRKDRTVKIASTPIAELDAMNAVPRKRLGALETPGFVLIDEFFEPLPEEELRLWNGEDPPQKKPSTKRK
jgi:hypothetical protein